MPWKGSDPLRYLITGGAGFIGSHVADALAARGDDVVLLDDLSTGRRSNVEHLLGSDRVQLIEGSVLDEELVDACVQESDVCMHLASAVGVQLIVSQPLDTLRRNMRGNDIVISTAARYRKRMLFTSTSEVYGKNSSQALREDSDRIVGSPFVARWAYATAKAFGEALAHSHHREEGQDFTVVRLFNTVGPRQTGAYGMVVPRLVRQALRGEELTVYGDGSQSRCFAHVYDTIRAIVQLMDMDESVGHVYNVGNTVETKILALAERVILRTGSTSTVRLVPYEEAYDEGFEELGRRRPDTTLLRGLTGWEPRLSVDDIIDDVAAFEQADLDVVPA